ncbi:PaaI family thioesterase [Mycobacterium sp. OAE908]|uniref:PaaI family thioesterase n=1 Tax=Mycobacterium sp. OAE908 TaxID=2817899 RepID=UPI001AE10A01
MIDDALLHRSPVHKNLGMSVVEYKPGFIVLSMPISDDISGLFEGTVHGGMLATFADTACATCLVGCYDDQSEATVTTDMHVRYYRQPREGPLRAEATMVHNGRTLLSAECSVFDAEDRVLIRSTATYARISVQGRATHARSDRSVPRSAG